MRIVTLFPRRGLLMVSLAICLAAACGGPAPSLKATSSPDATPTDNASASPGAMGVLRLTVHTFDGRPTWMVARLPMGADRHSDQWNEWFWADSSNGSSVAVLETETDPLPAGEYLLHIFAGAHRDHLAAVTIEPGAITDLAVTLSPMPVLIVERVLNDAGSDALSVDDAIALPDGTAVTVRGELVLDPRMNVLPTLCEQTYLTPGSCVHPAMPLAGLELDDVPGITPNDMIPGGFSALGVVVEGVLQDPAP